MQIDVTGKDCPWKDYTYRTARVAPVTLVKRPLADLAGAANDEAGSELIENGWYLGLVSPPGIQTKECIDVAIDEEAVDFRPNHPVKLKFSIRLLANSWTVAPTHRKIGEVVYAFDPETHRKSTVVAHARTHINRMLGIID